ncbi:hypothetical protein SK128_022804 [Halocaridina rubra]|uniref:Uncharacterized protein n=1 Tax=Halocaridina rubra TaxID=373956 RepID=A0AAN8XFV6_HALRR
MLPVSITESSYEAVARRVNIQAWKDERNRNSKQPAKLNNPKRPVSGSKGGSPQETDGSLYMAQKVITEKVTLSELDMEKGCGSSATEEILLSPVRDSPSVSEERGAGSAGQWRTCDTYTAEVFVNYTNVLAYIACTMTDTCITKCILIGGLYTDHHKGGLWSVLKDSIFKFTDLCLPLGYIYTSKPKSNFSELV